MISARMRDHTATRFLVAERKDRVGRAANLEGTGFLEIFALKEELRAALLVQGMASQHRRAVDSGANAVMRVDDCFPVGVGDFRNFRGFAESHLKSVVDVTGEFPRPIWFAKSELTQPAAGMLLLSC